MATFKIVKVEPAPPPHEVQITLTRDEAKGLYKLLHAGTGWDSLRVLELQDLLRKLDATEIGADVRNQYGENMSACFKQTAQTR